MFTAWDHVRTLSPEAVRTGRGGRGWSLALPWQRWKSPSGEAAPCSHHVSPSRRGPAQLRPSGTTDGRKRFFCLVFFLFCFFFPCHALSGAGLGVARVLLAG